MLKSKIFLIEMADIVYKVGHCRDMTVSEAVLALFLAMLMVPIILPVIMIMTIVRRIREEYKHDDSYSE